MSSKIKNAVAFRSIRSALFVAPRVFVSIIQIVFMVGINVNNNFKEEM